MRIKEVLLRLTKNWPAKIISLTAAILLFLFYRINSLEERFISVPVRLELNEGFVHAGPYPASARVILRGSGEGLFLIGEQDIEVFIDLSSHNSEGIFRAPLEYRKHGNAQRIEPLEVRIDPHEATVELERKLLKKVEVVPQIHGYPEKGYELVDYSVVPETVEIEGPRSHVVEVDSVQSEVLDLSDRQGDFTIRLLLESTDPYIFFRGGDTVEFTGFVREAIMLKTYDSIAIIPTGLDESLEVGELRVRGSVKVQGTQLFLEGFAPSNLRLMVDCSSIQQPGSYELPVLPTSPAGLLVVGYEPETITVEIRRGWPGVDD